MTEPDEALIWARSQVPEDWYEDQGDIEWRARAYRAGQAASAERIKALEAGVSDAIAYVEFQRPNAIDLDQLLRALRALLEEADQ